MRLYHFSDTHTYHEGLKLPDLSDIDVICFTGDESNERSPTLNEGEFYTFLRWYAAVDHPNKIYIPGNHSSYVYNNERTARQELEKNGIIYLNKTSITIDGVKLYGDPITPEFGDWVYMSTRDKLHKHWSLIPEDTDVLLSHGPRKGVLDLTTGESYGSYRQQFEMCGCTALGKRIDNLAIKVNLFGHIHNHPSITNTGTRIMNGVIYSNASCVVDTEFRKGIQYHGNIISL